MSSGRKEAMPSASDLGSIYDKPQFSLKQVKLICERLLKEQEVRLRYEYETLLNKKLEGMQLADVNFIGGCLFQRNTRSTCSSPRNSSSTAPLRLIFPVSSGSPLPVATDDAF